MFSPQQSIAEKIKVFEETCQKALNHLQKDRKFRKLNLTPSKVCVASNTLGDIIHSTFPLKEIIIHYPKTKNSLRVKEVVINGITVHFIPRDLTDNPYQLGELVPIMSVWRTRAIYAIQFDKALAEVGITYDTEPK